MCNVGGAPRARLCNMEKILKIKKIFLIISITLITLFSYSNIFARNVIDNIEMDVLIHDNGSATITQRWTGRFDEGTEVYLPIEDKSLIIRNLKVSKDGREYLEVDKWNVDWNFETKKWRYGINYTNKGYEICFGISQYGNSSYTFSYDIDPLVKSYLDADGFNFQFVNPGMGTVPTDVNIRIRVDDNKMLTENNARIWAFGYDGMISFTKEGYVVAFSNNKLNSDNYVNITLEIFKGLISPNININSTFDEVVLSRALEGSTYEETLSEAKKGPSLFEIIFALIFGLTFISFIMTIVAKIKRVSELKKYYKDCNYFRDTPNGGNIMMTNSLYSDFDIWKNKETNVIGAIIMKMINDKNLIPLQEKSYGLFGREKISTSLQVGEAPSNPDIKELYDIIVKAAGADNILQENELKKYAERNYEVLFNYLDSLSSKGHTALHQENGYARVYGNNLKDLSDVGKKELSEVYGLRKFLDEFTLINERGIMEGIIWEDLLVYATLFGIAKKVLSELKKVYPDKLVEIENYSYNYYISDIYFRSLYYNTLNAKRAADVSKMAQMAAEGFGGMASSSGGGGFSGGGSGGGTR